MALVAYGSSGDSESSDNDDNDQTSTSDIISSLKSEISPTEPKDQDALHQSNEDLRNIGSCDKVSKRSLFASLPPPKLSNSSEAIDLTESENKPWAPKSEDKKILNASSASDASTTDSAKSRTSLFASLPPPKRKASSIFHEDCDLPADTHSSSEINENDRASFSLPFKNEGFNQNTSYELSEQKTLKDGSVSNSETSLNGSARKKMKDHVKITIPSLSEFQEEDDEQPSIKKRKPLSFVTGLVSMLPEPRNKSLKEASRLLVPHVLSKKQDRVQDSTIAARKSSSLSAMSMQNRPSSLQKKLVSYDKIDSDEEENEVENNTPSCDYFSLEGNSSSVPLNNNPVADKVEDPTVGMTTTSVRSTSPSHLKKVSYDSSNEVSAISASFLERTSKIPNFGKNRFSTDNSTCISDMHTVINENKISSTNYISNDNDAPLSFRTGWAQTTKHQNDAAMTSSHLSSDAVDVPSYSEDYQNPYSEFEGKNMFSEEGFLRLQGKKRKGKEEDIQLIDIHADEQLPGSTEWLTKSITEEMVHRPSRKKHNLPTQQQRRKHQITYLAFQAKERELELKNQWSQNKMTRRQTQSKYGF